MRQRQELTGSQCPDLTLPLNETTGAIVPEQSLPGARTEERWDRHRYF